jgi:hypothetical protein
MMALLLLAPQGAHPPPLGFVLVLFLLVFFGGSLLSSRLMGVFQLYRAFPADKMDPIDANLGWLQIEFGTFRGHTPMSVKAGRRCLHLKQPFPFQPLIWLGPASIPWDQIRLLQPASTDWWAFWKAAEFTLGPEDSRIRLRGKAARKLQKELEAMQGQADARPSPMAPIRPS